MEERAAHGQRLPGPAVAGVADDRVPDRAEVDPDLVGAARLQGADELRHLDRIVEGPQDLVAGAGLLAPLVDRHPRRLPRRAPDGGVDEATRRVEACPTPGPGSGGGPPVPPARRRDRRRPPGSERRAGGPTSPCRGGARSPAGTDPPDAAQLRVDREQALDERPARLAGAGVHDEPGWLVDDEKVVVDVDDGNPHLGRGLQVGGGLRIGHVHLELAPAVSRADRLVAAVPSTRTAPPSTSAAASDRLTPVTMATMRSTRSPPSAPGTSSRTITAAGARAAVVAPASTRGARRCRPRGRRPPR